MPEFIDQTGKSISLDHSPQRIISLVPSQTELLSDLGLSDQIVGITKFCIHPENIFRSKPRIGGTKTINFDTIHQLKPDLIIANKEENVKEQIDELEKTYPVWTSDVSDISSAMDMIVSLGKICHKETVARKLTATIEESFSSLANLSNIRNTCYLIWKDPYMTVGSDTFIHSMLSLAGFQNMFANQHRYPQLTLDSLQQKGCEHLLLSSEPYPFKQLHIDQMQNLLPNTRIILVDGEMFSWYGSRMLKAAKYFTQLRASISNTR